MTLDEMENALREYGLTYSGTDPQMAMIEFMEHAVASGNLKTFDTYPMKYNRRGDCIGPGHSGDGWYKIKSSDPRGGLDTFYLAMAAEAAVLRRGCGLALEKIKVEADDTLVVTVPGRLRHDQSSQLVEWVQKAFPGRKVLVLADGIKMQAIDTSASAERRAS